MASMKLDAVRQMTGATSKKQKNNKRRVRSPSRGAKHYLAGSP
jgi:hypothetical protein